MRTRHSIGHRNRLKEQIIKGSRLYKKYLINRVFLIITEDGDEVEVLFSKLDFKHLTGIESDLNDNDFFEHCVNGTINIGNIFEYQKYNWDTLKNKCKGIASIDKLIYENTQKVLILNELRTQTAVFPIAIMDVKNNMCVGFVSSINRARSMRKASSSAEYKSSKNIIAIFSRDPKKNTYNQLIYISNILGVYQKNEKLIKIIEDPTLSRFLEIITRPR